MPRTILVYDTETTGMWDSKAPPIADHQPHIVQLAFALFSDGIPVRSEAYLIKSDFKSDPGAEAVHGKTMEARNEFGVSYLRAMKSFISAVQCAQLCVAHNEAFDSKVINRALMYVEPFVEEKEHPTFTFGSVTSFCTMNASTSLCALPGSRGGYKWPKLIEAYRLLVDPKGFDGAHDALADVMACAKLYFKLKEMGHA